MFSQNVLGTGEIFSEKHFHPTYSTDPDGVAGDTMCISQHSWLRNLNMSAKINFEFSNIYTLHCALTPERVERKKRQTRSNPPPDSRPPPPPDLQYSSFDGRDPACGEWGVQGHHVVLSCATHTPHAQTHMYVHSDPITHHHHGCECPTWPFILSWAVAELPYTSVGSWLTGREDTPTWSPFNSSTTPPSPQTPSPRPPLHVPGENTLEPKCFRAGCFLGRKGFVSGQCALLR